MRTLATVLAQIEKLQAEADQLRSQERAGVVQRIREAITFYQIDISELMGESPSKKKKEKKEEATTAPKGKPKGPAYVHGALYSDGTRTWRGHARVPQWLIDHAAGRALSEFMVEEAKVKAAKPKPKSHAKFVRSTRTTAGLSQEEFGKHLGVSSKTVSKWETGQSRPSDAHIEMVRKLGGWYQRHGHKSPAAVAAQAEAKAENDVESEPGISEEARLVLAHLQEGTGT